MSSVGLGLLLAVASVNAYSASRTTRDSQLQRLAGKPELAIQSGLRATNADPNRADYWDDLGLAYVSGQRLTDAVSAFDRAVKLAPYNVRFLGDLASANLVLVQRGDAAAGSRAQTVADRAVRTDPNNPQAHLTRAIVMQVTGDVPEALKSVERALALDSSYANPRLDLTAIQVMNASGRTADAIATARRAIGTLDLNDTVQIRVELARALVAAGQPAQALAELDAALAIRPNDAAALQLRAQIRAGTTQ
jgi:tetratricopeptide (TPR) repeat protein